MRKGTVMEIQRKNLQNDCLRVWVRQQLTTLKLGLHEVAELLLMSVDEVNGYLAGQLEWGLAFRTHIATVLGVVESDLQAMAHQLTGKQHSRAMKKRTELDECAEFLQLHCRFFVCRSCRRMGLLLVGRVGIEIYSVAGALWALMEMRRCGWLSFDTILLLGPTVTLAGLPLFDPAGVGGIMPLCRDIYDRIPRDTWVSLPVLVESC